MFLNRINSLFLNNNLKRSYQIRNIVGYGSAAQLFQEELIVIKNSQRKYQINIKELELYTQKIIEILNIKNLNYSISIVGNEGMRKVYFEAFQKRKTTDILAWAPEGYLQRKKTKVPLIASIVICPDYVQKRLEIDKEYYDCGELDLSEDKGVSKRMATLFTVQERIPLLLIHGMLHSIGYDHETDEEWIKMTDKEDQIFNELQTIFPNGLKV